MRPRSSGTSAIPLSRIAIAGALAGVCTWSAWTDVTAYPDGFAGFSAHETLTAAARGTHMPAATATRDTADKKGRRVTIRRWRLRTDFAMGFGLRTTPRQHRVGRCPSARVSLPLWLLL